MAQDTVAGRATQIFYQLQSLAILSGAALVLRMAELTKPTALQICHRYYCSRRVLLRRGISPTYYKTIAALPLAA
jgi:hypothetical protein